MDIQRYWGKAMRPLEYDWRMNKKSDEALAKSYDLTPDELSKKIKVGRWQRHNQTAALAQYHLLVWHCLDVAACAEAYLKHHPVLLNWFAEQLDQTPDATCQYLVFWIALHDLGKFSGVFQKQRADIVAILTGEQNHYNQQNNTNRHDSLGYWLWSDQAFRAQLLKMSPFFSKKALLNSKALVRSVTGHHGQPPLVNEPSFLIEHAFTEGDRQTAVWFIHQMAELMVTDEQAKVLLKHFDDQDHMPWQSSLKKISWHLAGITVMADWLGSNTRFFPYRQHFSIAEMSDPITDYWQNTARPAAQLALSQTGARPVALQAAHAASDLFPQIKQFTPLQQWASAQDWTSPSLYILEDTMGAGKTEAALILTAQILKHQPNGGLFVALPTMATANAMYARMSDCYQRLFVQGTSLLLAHGKKQKNAIFKASIDVLPPDVTDDPLVGEQSASARCQAWLADQGKKNLLAPVGVGTIDQVLLGVLHSKHQSLRLLGTFGKVLIVDEVHACDTYMLTLLETVVEFHAKQGGSVILLSATLPQLQKQRLVNAYAKGLAQPASTLIAHDYPLATIYDGQRIIEQSILPRPESKRQIKLAFLDDIEHVFTLIQQQLLQGKSVVWMRNTVADVMSAAQRCQTMLDITPENFLVFHARFVGKDRQDKEEQLLQWLGKNSNAEQRQNKLIICSQVAEMSIDFDADVLISDLAPIDSVLQRAGRLGRHIRDADGNRMDAPDAVDQRGPMTLWVLTPVWSDTPTVDWYAQLSKGAAMVYPHHAQLWLGLNLMRQAGVMSLPQDARTWVDQVYAAQEEDYPHALQKSADQVEGQQSAHQSVAHLALIKINNGYEANNSFGTNWWEESRACTRLGEVTHDVLLLKIDQQGQITRWSDTSTDLDDSVVRVAGYRIAQSMDEHDPRLMSYLDSLQGAARWMIPVLLSQNEQGEWCGMAKNDQQRVMRVMYSSSVGLQVVRLANKA